MCPETEAQPTEPPQDSEACRVQYVRLFEGHYEHEPIEPFLDEMVIWCNIMSQLGLTPPLPDGNGVAGNMSAIGPNGEMIVTRSSKSPNEKVTIQDLVAVTGWMIGPDQPRGEESNAEFFDQLEPGQVVNPNDRVAYVQYRTIKDTPSNTAPTSEFPVHMATYVSKSSAISRSRLLKRLAPTALNVLGRFSRFDRANRAHTWLRKKAYPAKDCLCVLHGHCNLFQFCDEFFTRITKKKHPEGTLELADEVANSWDAPGNEDLHMVQMEKHGFVCYGDSIQEAGRRLLNIYTLSLMNYVSMIETRVNVVPHHSITPDQLRTLHQSLESDVLAFVSTPEAFAQIYPENLENLDQISPVIAQLHSLAEQVYTIMKQIKPVDEAAPD